MIQLTDALVGMTWWPRGTLPKIAAALYGWTLGWLILKCADRVVFFHPQPTALLKRLGITKKSEVIPTGIDPAPFTHVRSAQEPKDKGVKVSYVGRLESVKGVDDYLTAVVPLKENFADLTIDIAGWVKPHHPLVTAFQDKVSFLGLVNVPELLSRTNIFTLPSYSEGLSNALMEAMASGCACIASDVGGNSYLIQNGVSGLLFPAGDRAALQAHVRRLLNDPAKRQALGKAARRRIEDMFSWDIVGKRYQQLFNDYLS